MRILSVVTLLTVLVVPLLCQTPVGEHTTFYAGFEDSLRPDYAAGGWQALTRGEVQFVDGYIGRAISLPSGSHIRYPAQGNIQPDSGTVEVWLQWTAETAALDHFSVFFEGSPSNNYVRINRIAPDRLGMAFHGGPEDDLQWQRVDFDPQGWDIGTWHHIAGTWEGGTITLYIDGEAVDQSTQDNAMIDIGEEMSIGSPVTVDSFTLSSVARSEEVIRRHAAIEPGSARPIYLTDIAPATSEQAMGHVGIDHDTALDDRKLPLIIENLSYGRGLSVHAPGSVSFDVPDGMEQMTALAGVSSLTPNKSANITISLDGNELATAALTAGETAQELTFDISGGGRLEIAASADGPAGAAVIIAHPVFVGQGSAPPAPFAQELTEAEIAIQRMRTHCGEFTFDLPEDRDYAVYDGHPVDIVDPDAPPMSNQASQMELFASPGEYEAAQLTIFTAVDMPSVEVSLGPLQGDEGALPSDAVQIRLVRRVLQRKGYWMDRAPANYETVSRFLFPNRTFWLPAGNFKEIQVLAHVPDDVARGKYRGTLQIEPEGLEPFSCPVSLRVLPIDLDTPDDKTYGVYYRYWQTMDRPEVVSAEFSDISAHGCRMLYASTGVRFLREESGTITWSLGDVQRLLENLRAHGFSGTLPVMDRIHQLARLMGYEPLDEEGRGERIAEKEDLLQIVREALADLKKLDEQYPEFTLVLTHMDEVFGRGRLPAFMDAARVIRKTSDFPIYITIHMMPGRWESYMKESDHLIDIRCINGHSLEEWLTADDNDWDELRQMLQESGDEGWMYHNMRGSFFPPEWNRIINGLFMWASPLKVHVPWMYYSYGGNPFDDTDTDQFDFGYAFPHPDDPTQMISTLHWEAFREGYDDMRYIATL
ncbi:MAG: LamG-like jellyroll fold domain-containing protein, partial [Armatimonadota bacterium]